MKILVLEDDPVSLHRLSHDLQTLGHEALGAQDVVEAMNVYYQNEPIDLIITDLELPYGNGEDFVKDIRLINPKVPIIIVSGTISAETLRKLKKYRCKDFLVKPYDKNRLESLLADL